VCTKIITHIMAVVRFARFGPGRHARNQNLNRFRNFGPCIKLGSGPVPLRTLLLLSILSLRLHLQLIIVAGLSFRAILFRAILFLTILFLTVRTVRTQAFVVPEIYVPLCLLVPDFQYALILRICRIVLSMCAQCVYMYFVVVFVFELCW
jgi:hypothetical protein